MSIMVRSDTSGAAPSRQPLWRRRPPEWAVVIAAIFLLLLAVAAIAPGLFTGSSPLATEPAVALQPPSATHLFGTDQSGRDVYTRIVFGARDSMTVAVIAMLISVGLGLLIGLTAGTGGRVADSAMSRLIEVMFSFPALLLTLMLLTVFGASVGMTTVAIGIALTPLIARLVRAEALRVMASGYVEAARVLGHSRARILLLTVLPNAVRPLAAFAFLNVGGALIWATTLGYLGFGVQPPNPEWGAMLADAQAFLLQAWWLPLFTGLVVVATAVSANVVGNGIQRLIARDGEAR